MMRKMLGLVAPVIATVTMVGGLQAQTASYYTEGYFSGAYAPCNNPVPVALGVPGNASCSGSGLTLQYFGTTGTDIGDGSTASIGRFSLTGDGAVDLAPGLVFFNLIIEQTNPSTGAGTFVGSISGSISTVNGNSSSLIWTPNQEIAIGPVHYTMVFDNIGPATDIGLAIPINNSRGIDALVDTAPEPGSVVLTATGLVGVGAVVRRRRKNTAA